MAKKIAVITFIFVCTSLAWMLLGATIEFRTQEYDEKLADEVGDLWGTPHYQYAPVFSHSYNIKTERYDEGQKRNVIEIGTVTESLPLLSSDIDVVLSLDYRKKGLLWYSTYVVDFDGTYRTKNEGTKNLYVDIFLEFPSENAEYDNFNFFVNESEVKKLDWMDRGVGTKVKLRPGEDIDFRVVYTSRGQDMGLYYFGGGSVTEVRDFKMTVSTDFIDIDFPNGSISPTSKEETESGMKLVWEYTKKISGHHIGIEMPKKINPGPLAKKITFFAPISLLFFFFILFIITTLGEINIHPMNFFFLACAFFAFHLLFAYLVDHISVGLSFLISSVVSLFLVVSYLRLVVGARFALVEAGISQLIYLVLFSYSFFFKGYTGLIITIASIITLFILMQMTGRIDWEKKFLAASKKGKSGRSG